MHPAIKVVPLEVPGRGWRSKETCLIRMHATAIDLIGTADRATGDDVLEWSDKTTSEC
jgi:hypothetical protein